MTGPSRSPTGKPGAALRCDGSLAAVRPAARAGNDAQFRTIALPGNSRGDIQVAGEYVAYAIRTMHAAYGSRIDIIGHSQGEGCPAGRCASGPIHRP